MAFAGQSEHSFIVPVNHRQINRDKPTIDPPNTQNVISKTVDGGSATIRYRREIY